MTQALVVQNKSTCAYSMMQSDLGKAFQQL